MIQNIVLVLVIFMSNGVEYRFPLMNRISDETCVDLRDQIRGQVNYLNNLDTPTKYEGEVVEFVDAECVTQKNFY